MGYTESDFPIIMVDVEEDEEEKKKRGLFFLVIAGALILPTLIVFLVLSLMTGTPEASEQDRTGGPADSDEQTAELIRPNGAGDAATFGESEGAGSKRLVGHRGRLERHRANGPRLLAVPNRFDADLKVSLMDFLTNLNQDLYRGVEVHTVNNRIESVAISVNSNVLDALHEDEIIEDLDKIERFLDKKYPGVVPFVTLEFSDSRTDFKLRASALAEDYIHRTIESQFKYISPRIYKSVDVEVELRKTTERLGREIWKGIQVKKVDIHVNSAEWDAESATDKVYLLNYTAQFLKERYPEVTPFITLKFDDGRQDLQMKSSVLET